MGQRAWSGFEAEWARGCCKTLAELARWLDTVGRCGQQELTESILGSEEAPFPATREVAAAVVGRVVVSETGGPGPAARALRVLGVLICAALGRPEKCPCWRAMVKSGIDHAREQLREGFPEPAAP
ncbi:hypothetical protein [Haloactinomyces albus]|uniref:Uncharacterized protein n=1 Tax=Haloactinomyces albus TaxID=1352928 RepID=A0AAE3Z9W2_9ACTN|nr:hypothetical protein [Haloactinomyces albus]MDR7301008.1 hypothetical protein [Haloactinomyces albus]